jgi:hypothetical protein
MAISEGVDFLLWITIGGETVKVLIKDAPKGGDSADNKIMPNWLG